MGVLIAHEWRLLRQSFFLWLALAIANAALMATSGWRTSFNGLTTFPFVLGALAAALGARSFAAGVGGSAVWLRMLPLSHGRLFAGKVCVALGLLAAGLGLVAFVQAWILPVLLGTQGAEPVFEAAEWPLGVLYCFTAFAASAFFATSFERVAASRQAGLAGFVVGLTTLHEMSRLAIVLLSVVGLAAAFRLARRRGVDEWMPRARVLRRVSSRDLVLVLPAQVGFVILPFWAWVSAEVARPAPFLERSPLALAVLACLLFGLAALPWAWTDTRERGVQGWRRIVALGLSATGLGVWLWKALRPRGAVLRCARCLSRRLEARPQCADCGGERLESVGSRFAPYTPLGVAGTVLVFAMGGSCVFGGLRYIHAYEIRSELPGAEVRLGQRVAGDGILRGWELGPRMGAWIGNWTNGQGSGLRPESEIVLPTSIETFSAQLSPAIRSGALLSHPDYLPDLLGPSNELDVRYRGHPCSLRAPGVTTQTQNFVTFTEVMLNAECPELDRFVVGLLDPDVLGELGAERVRAAHEWGDAVPMRLLELCFGQPSRRALARARLREIVAARPEVVARDVGRLFDALDHRIEWVRKSDGQPGYRHRYYSFVAAELFALAACGDSIADPLRARIERGDTWCLVVAGLGRITACWSACEQAWRTRVSTEAGGLDLAAWALLALDVERALPLIYRAWPRLSTGSRVVLGRQLGCTGRSDVLDWLESRGESTPWDAALETSEAGWVLEDYLH